MARRAAAGKPGGREIEAAPEEMHRARLAEKAAAEQLEDAVDLDERAPEAMDRVGIVAGMAAVVGKAGRVRDLARHVVDGDRDAEAAEQRENAAMELGDGLRREGKPVLVAAAGAHDQPVSDEIEIDFEILVADRHG
jgi:hypothetical protein